MTHKEKQPAIEYWFPWTSWSLCYSFLMKRNGYPTDHGTYCERQTIPWSGFHRPVLLHCSSWAALAQSWDPPGEVMGQMWLSSPAPNQEGPLGQHSIGQLCRLFTKNTCAFPSSVPCHPRGPSTITWQLRRSTSSISSCMSTSSPWATLRSWSLSLQRHS